MSDDSVGVAGVRPQVGAMIPFAEVADQDGETDVFLNKHLVTEAELYYHVMKTVSPLPIGRTQGRYQ